MNYKEKHSHQLRGAFGALALSMAMLIPAGCINQNEKSEDKETQGLLNPKPVSTLDKYNEKVTLYLVDVPVYTSAGERKTDQYVLTRGLKSSTYHSGGEKRYTRKALINGSEEPVYVQVDENNAVVTERGFVGLFVDDNNKVVVVSDERVSDFMKDRAERRYGYHSTLSSNTHEVLAKAEKLAEKRDTTLNIVVTDSIGTDTIQTPPDSIAQPKAEADTSMVRDSLSMIRQDVRE